MVSIRHKIALKRGKDLGQKPESYIVRWLICCATVTEEITAQLLLVREGCVAVGCNTSSEDLSRDGRELH